MIKYPNMHRSFASILFMVCMGLLSGCSESEGLVGVSNFNPITNAGSASDSVINWDADLSNAIVRGIEIPTAEQIPGGAFIFSFSVQNNTPLAQGFYYKIYYHNESYSFPYDHEFSDENFYGSWTDSITFKSMGSLKPGETLSVKDSFKIVGNPRNEKLYYGADIAEYFPTEERVRGKEELIKSSPEWMGQVKLKAAKIGKATEEQVRLDALWALDHDRLNDSTYNCRWKRNPRMGKYSFMLVVTNDQDINKIPAEVKNIGLAGSKNKFVDPYAYFLYKDGKDLVNTKVKIADTKLKVKSSLDLMAGIYVGNKNSYKSKDAYTKYCGDSYEMYIKAQFEQYFHYINKNFPLKNIPEIADVIGENMTRQKYEELKKNYENSPRLVNTYVNSSDCPCKTVYRDSVNKCLVLVNPGNESGTELKKEHVGVMSRIGFTYGKWRAKIKFPELINKDNVWNGLTNAFWLLYQDDKPWNQRRPCISDIAYIPKSEPDNYEALKHSKPVVSYSEVDFEIIKESQFWPKTSYPGNDNYPKEDAAVTDEVMVTCTNWDMACHEPKNFGIGAKEYTIDGHNLVLHRWDDFYKALTAKIPAKDDELFKKDYYYFELEWLPEKLIWKIGPEKDKMKVICVMDKDVSAIPGNQMVMVVTQEWHSQEWWPTAPFKQNFIPFPKNNIVGKILEVEIE